MYQPMLTKLSLLLAAASLTTAALAQSPAVPGAYDIRTFGAVGDGETKCTDAIRKAIEAATAKGGGTIYIPPGQFLTGPIHLQSQITLYLDAGAVLRFSTNFGDYLPMVPSRWEGIEVTNFSPLIYARDARNIAIRGRGTLDGQGKPWWDVFWRVKSGDTNGLEKWQQEFARLNPHPLVAATYKTLQTGFLRPPFIQPYNCTNVLIEGVTIINSPFWTVTPLYCENVTVHAVAINNPDSSPNTDGINPDSCRKVHISNCDISVGDDCITIKSGRDADGRRVGRPAENYTISNCTMERGHGGVVIGSEMSGGVKNITIANCVFTGTDRGIRIKAARGRGGFVEDVRVSNVVMRGILREAVVLTTFYEKSEPEPVSERTPVFRNIHLNGITGDAKTAAELTGLTEMPVSDVSFVDVQLDTETGIKIKDARDLSFQNVTINASQGPALLADKTEGLELGTFRTARPSAKAPVVDLKDVKRVFVHGCCAVPGMGAFIRVPENCRAQVVLEGNNLGAPDKAVVAAEE
jgi:polygalacturonase